MRGNIVEILQLAEWLSLFVLIGMGLLYMMTGRDDYARRHYRSVLFIAAAVFMVCVFVLHVLDF